MTVFTVTVIIQNYTLTSKQSNKHILTVYPNDREARKEFYKYKRKKDGFIHILISRLTTKPTLSLYHI